MKRSLGLIVVAALFSACSSTPVVTGDAGPDSGPLPDSGKPPKDAGKDVQAPPIDGTTDMTVTVQEYNFGMNTPAALAGADVRVENAQGGFVDGTTDGSGVAHIKVDVAKGPFDVTAAKIGYEAISVLNQAGPLATPIVTYKVDNSAFFNQQTVSGSISGKTNSGDRVQLDLYAFQTVLAKPNEASYSTKFSYYTSGPNPTMNITALELDGSDNIVNAMQAPMTARTNGAMTVNIAFPQSPPAVTTSNITVSFPGAGVVKGNDVVQVGDPVSDVHAGNVVVVKQITNPTAFMFVGVGNATLPSNNASAVKVQSLAGANIAPDYYEVLYQAANMNVFVRSYTLTNNATFTIGQVDSLDAGGTSLDDTKFGSVTQGYDGTEFALVVQNAQQQNTVVWSVWGAGASLAQHGIPHLPAAIKVGDLTGGGGITGSVAIAARFKGGSVAPWSEYNKPTEISVAFPVGALDQGSRP